MFRKGLIAAALVTAALLSVSQTAEARKNKDSDRVAESSQTERNFMGAHQRLIKKADHAGNCLRLFSG